MTSRPRLSVLAPVRGRLSLLKTMIDSLWQTVEEPQRIEVILRCDFDDTTIIDFLRRDERAKLVVGPRHRGYANLAILINEAARLAKGELLLVVNDDSVFETVGWERKLLDAAAQFPDGIFNLGVDTENGGNYIFPCVSKKQCEVLGWLFDERLVYTDLWLRDVCAHFGRAVRVDDVRIHHNWQGQSPDQQNACRETQSSDYADRYRQYVAEGVEAIRAARILQV